MAKPNLPNTAAEDAVFDNLGLTREDLGMDQNDDFGSGNEDLEQAGGSGNEGLGDQDFNIDDTGDQGQDPSDDRRSGDQRSRVTHTEPEVRPLAAGAEVKPDKQGNLVNKEGKIIARAGREARLYQDAFKAKGSVRTLQGQVNEVSTRLKKAVEIGQGLHRDLVAARATNDAIKQLGVDQNEQLSAIRLFKDLRDNPKETLKKILTRAAANGITMDDLGTASGVDPKSLIDLVRETIGKELNPLKESTAAATRAKQEADQVAARHNEIQTHVVNFFDANPDAKPYLPVFQQTVQKFPGMTLGEIWARIQLHQVQNPQPRRNQNSQRGQNGARRSLPQGRNMPASNGQDDLAPVSDTYSDIVKAALDSAGITR